MGIASPNCATCGTRASSTFATLSVDQVGEVAHAKTCNFYGRNAIVFQTGHYPRGVYCIHGGHVKVTRIGADGREQIIRFAGAGDLVGYSSMLTGEPYTVNCVAVEESHICFVPAELLHHMIRENPQLALRVMQDIAHELDDAERRVVEIAQKSVRERVAEALLVIKQTFGTEEDGVTLANPLTREEIASIVGTAPESVIRTLSEFKHDKLIETSGKMIRLLNLRGIVRAANVQD